MTPTWVERFDGSGEERLDALQESLRMWSGIGQTGDRPLVALKALEGCKLLTAAEAEQVRRGCRRSFSDSDAIRADRAAALALLSGPSPKEPA